MFDDVLFDLMAKYSDVIIIGDFNENLLHRELNGSCSKFKSQCCSTCRFISCLDKYGLESIGSMPTNFDQTPSLIDLIVSNNPSNFAVFKQISTSLSNHDLLLASYKVTEPIAEDKQNLRRNYRAIETGCGH